MRRPSPNHWKTDPLAGFRQIHDQGYRSLIFFTPARKLNLSTSSKVSHSACSSSATPIRGVPLNTIIVLPCCHRRPQRFPTNHRRWPLTRDMLRNQEEHRCAGISHTVAPSPRIPQLLLLFHSPNPADMLGESHHTQLPSLPCKSLPPELGHFLFTLACLPSASSIPHFSMACSFDLAPTTSPVFCPLLPLLLTCDWRLGIFFFLPESVLLLSTPLAQ